MEPTLEPCNAHAQFLAVVGIDSAMPLLFRCPDCEIYNIDPSKATARAQAVIDALMKREAGEL
jgi:hypothetical protein